MTTTTKKANGTEKPAVEKEWEDAGQASSGVGESDAAAWVPHWTKYNAKVVEKKLTTVPAGSHAKEVLIGTLTVQPAFGEARYFVDSVNEDKTITRMALPLHGTLTSALDRLRLDPAPKVRIGFLGEAPRAKQGQNAAFLYDIRVMPKDALLTEARTDPKAPALLPIHKANKAKRDAAKKAAEEAAGEVEAAPNDE